MLKPQQSLFYFWYSKIGKQKTFYWSGHHWFRWLKHVASPMWYALGKWCAPFVCHCVSPITKTFTYGINERKKASGARLHLLVYPFYLAIKQVPISPDQWKTLRQRLSTGGWSHNNIKHFLVASIKDTHYFFLIWHII